MQDDRSNRSGTGLTSNLTPTTLTSGATTTPASGGDSASNTASSGTRKSGLSDGALAGVVVGAAAFLGLVLAIVIVLYRRRVRLRGAELPIQAPRASAMRPKSNMTFSGFGAPTISNPFADPAGQPPLPALRAWTPNPSAPKDPFSNVPGSAASETSFYSNVDLDVEKGQAVSV